MPAQASRSTRKSAKRTAGAMSKTKVATLTFTGRQNREEQPVSAQVPVLRPPQSPSPPVGIEPAPVMGSADDPVERPPIVESPQQQTPLGLYVGNSKFQTVKYLSAGSFGSLYLGRNAANNQEVAIKVEPLGCDKPQLHLEYGFYKKLHKLSKGVPRIYMFGPIGRLHNALVMELLGPNLDKMLEQCGGRFSLRTVVQLAIQFLFLYRGLHECGILYRDTKPANFLLGLPNTDKWWIVHVVDLGFCKEWRLPDGSHIPFQENKPFTGTVRYMSINNNMGYEQSRRDDLEALSYMLVYFFKGRLPWQGITASNPIRRYAKICRCKEATPPEDLCAGMPNEFCFLLRTVRLLGFENRPDYGRLIGPFINLLAREYVLEPNDRVYDWTHAHRIKPPFLRYAVETSPEQQNDAPFQHERSTSANYARNYYSGPTT